MKLLRAFLFAVIGIALAWGIAYCSVLPERQLRAEIQEATWVPVKVSSGMGYSWAFYQVNPGIEGIHIGIVTDEIQKRNGNKPLHPGTVILVPELTQ